VALHALKMKIGAEAMKVQATSALPFTNEQMFFVARAKFFCDNSQNDHGKFAKQLRDEDPHAADKVRVNAVAMQMSEFADAFHCKSSDAMVIDEKELCYLMSNKSNT
jgi:putative endopeptidase